MPLLSSSTYKAPVYLFNGHAETIYPSIKGKGPVVNYSRERLELLDGDFLDLDWLKGGNNQCLVISHGLEGSSDRYYMRRAAHFFNSRGWDILAWNCRSCSGEMNRLPRFYHHGDTGDLKMVVEQASLKEYENLVLLGYSMGGSMTLKYLGENGVHPIVKGAITFSVPCNLRDSATQLKQRGNRFYEQRFLKKLLGKVRLKGELLGIWKDIDLTTIKEFDHFHELFTVPLHGFRDLEDFFSKATCDQYLNGINTPTLIVNALNDPMLGEACYPKNSARSNPNLYLETPSRGGHTGFTLHGTLYSWMEIRAQQFIDEVIFQK